MRIDGGLVVTDPIAFRVGIGTVIARPAAGYTSLSEGAVEDVVPSTGVRVSRLSELAGRRIPTAKLDLVGDIKKAVDVVQTTTDSGDLRRASRLRPRVLLKRNRDWSTTSTLSHLKL